MNLHVGIHLQYISGIANEEHCTKAAALLASGGNKTFIDDPMFFLEMRSDKQVREIDPGSDLYPFMVEALGEMCDLSAVYACC